MSRQKAKPPALVFLAKKYYRMILNIFSAAFRALKFPDD
jgi:hypothetical protein